jgi:hypothetical protein
MILGRLKAARALLEGVSSAGRSLRDLVQTISDLAQQIQPRA